MLMTINFNDNILYIATMTREEKVTFKWTKWN